MTSDENKTQLKGSAASARAPAGKLAGVTICALNYLPKAVATRESFLAAHDGADFYIVIVDRRDEEAIAPFSRCAAIWAEDLGVENFEQYAFMYDIIELSTNIKPAVLSRLLGDYEKVLYLDPDIVVYRELEPALARLDSSSIVVTPHSLTPVLDGESPSDLDFLRFGTFNLGFIGVRAGEEARAFLAWWGSRCLLHGFYEPQMGLAVDQGWMDLAPCYFPGLSILREVGMNMAFWNLHERTLSKDPQGNYLVNGDRPLYFFHFSSFAADDPHAIANKQSRFKPGSRPDLHELLDDYAKSLRANDSTGLIAHPYSYERFASGEVITPALRRFYAANFDSLRDELDPFSADSKTLAWAKKHHLIGTQAHGGKRLNFKDLGRYSGQTRIIQGFLSLMLRILGPDRYFNLMRYMVFISSIRNQKDVLR